MYSTKDLQDFVSLKNSQQQLTNQAQIVQKEMIKIQKNLDSINRLLEQYKELENVKGMFNFIGPEPIEDIQPNYVTEEQKKTLLIKLFSDYQTLNSGATRVPFSWLKKTLDNQYNIKTRSVSNFFNKLLSRYEKTGGNRNKCVVIA
tara:strand:+ start:218 stop:655 length:438 start_codon:yes stop_codon:yes gene_type:complete